MTAKLEPARIQIDLIDDEGGSHVRMIVAVGDAKLEVRLERDAAITTSVLLMDAAKSIVEKIDRPVPVRIHPA